jgi:hypothetical protein
VNHTRTVCGHCAGRAPGSPFGSRRIRRVTRWPFRIMLSSLSWGPSGLAKELQADVP